MAVPGNAYPAVQLDARGDVVDSGVVVQFTDSTDQPGSGGGGSSPLSTLTLEDANGVGQGISVAALVTGGASFTGSVQASLSFAALIGAMAQVYDLGLTSYVLAGMVASTADDFDITGKITVTDAAGTNVATAASLIQLPQPVTDLAASGTLTGGTWTIVQGADLSASGNTLSSTAGGNYFVYVSLSCGWD